jgi:hypothetical protein
MGVDQARHGRPPVEVEDRRSRPGAFQDVTRASDRGNHAGLDKERLGDAPGSVERADAPADEGERIRRSPHAATSSSLPPMRAARL